MKIKHVINSCFQSAKNKKIEAGSKRELHNERSKAWVEYLTNSLRETFPNNATIRIFSKHNDSNRKDFGVSELLYDITVVRVASVESAFHKKNLLYFKESLWQVESEFARDSRQALIDFNKLVLGSAQNKLFIGPLVRDQASFMKVLVPAASVCSGNLFAAFIPHPSKWDNNLPGPRIGRFLLSFKIHYFRRRFFLATRGLTIC